MAKILLAEDDTDMRRFLVKALQNAGFDVTSYDNCLSAYQRLREEVRRYSAALADTPHVLVLTKRDLLPPADPLPPVPAPEAAAVLTISSAAGTGLDELKEFLWKFVADFKGAEVTEVEAQVAEEPGYWEFMDDE